MFTVNINGKDYTSSEDKSLLNFLRDDLHLTATKNGCDQGACGACAVIADGKTIRACVMKLSRLEGKKIITLEGLTEREKEVYGYAFAKCGAVQCGFCIPGMVISAKALIDVNPEPTREDVQKAIRTNICRCTGYVKIIDAILLAAEIFRGAKEIDTTEPTGKVGESLPRVDAVAKTLGTAQYVDDIVVDGMVYAKAVRPPAARCKINGIDASEAMKLPGTIAVYTAEDIPGNKKIGHLQKDYDVMIGIGEETRFIGDAIAIVVTEEKNQLEEAVKAVKIDCDILEPLTSPQQAMEDGAPQIHGQGFMQFGNHFTPENNVLSYQELKRGDAAKALEESKFLSEGDYYTPFTEHAFMEPECAIGMPYEDGVKVITGGQGIYDEYREIAEELGIKPEQVRIQSAYVGGGFGGKEDMSVQHHAALAAYLCKKPVKILLTRQESINIHPKRHPMWMHFKVGCDENGILQGLKANIISDTGAYASLGGPVLQRACTHAAGPYNFQNVDIEGRAVYTNNTPAGAYRGFGVTQSCFAMECAINDLAEQVGISPLEIRLRNAITPGDELPNGQLADEGTAFKETLEAVKDFYDEYSNKEGYYVGIASAMKNAGLGVGVPDTGRCNIAIIDGKAHIRTSASGIGQGLQTIVVQMICEAAGLTPSQVVIEHPDTKYTPDSGTTTASRQTVFTGEATKKAARLLKEALDSGKTLKDLEGEVFKAEYTFDSDPMGSPKKNPVSHVGYGYATHAVAINEDGIVEKIIAAHDSGTIINPITAGGQVDGGVVMSMGYGLTEDFPLEDGVPKVKYGTLGLLKATQVPEIEVVFVEKNNIDLAYGAKGIGEISAIPTAPALQNAYYNKDGVFRTSLPLENTAYKKPKKAKAKKK